jgi:hypothetical protein
MAALAAFACSATGADCEAPAAAAGKAGTVGALAETPEAATAPEDAEAPAALDAPTAAPVASSAGTVNTAPTRKRLGSCDINALGFASNNAFEARASVPRSCDCVAAIAASLSDCPG